MQASGSPWLICRHAWLRRRGGMALPSHPSHLLPLQGLYLRFVECGSSGLFAVARALAAGATPALETLQASPACRP